MDAPLHCNGSWMNWSNCRYVFSDENNASCIAIKVGRTDLIVRMCRQLDQFILLRLHWNSRYFHQQICANNNRAVHPTSIAMKPVIFSSTVTCGAIKSVHPTSIAMTLAMKLALFWSKNTCHQLDQFIQLRLQWHLHYFNRRIRVDNKISSSNFACNEARVIFIEEYVSSVRSGHPTSLAMKPALQ